MSVIGITLAFVFSIPILALLVDSQIGRALARRIEPREGDTALRRDMEMLAERVDHLQTDMEQLAEENDFLRKLLDRGDEPPR